MRPACAVNELLAGLSCGPPATSHIYLIELYGRRLSEGLAWLVSGKTIPWEALWPASVDPLAAVERNGKHHLRPLGLTTSDPG